MPADDQYLYDEFIGLAGTGATDFDSWAELYRESGSTRLDPDEDAEMFFQFLNAYYPDTEPHSQEWWRDIREDYMNLAEITEEDIDWGLYRALMDAISP